MRTIIKLIHRFIPSLLLCLVIFLSPPHCYFPVFFFASLFFLVSLNALFLNVGILQVFVGGGVVALACFLLSLHALPDQFYPIL